MSLPVIEEKRRTFAFLDEKLTELPKEPTLNK